MKTTGTRIRPPVKCVIFDIDGVLIDTASMVASGQSSVAQHLGVLAHEAQSELLQAWQDLAITIGGEVTPTFLECLLKECELRGITSRPDLQIYDAFMAGYWRSVVTPAETRELMAWIHANKIRSGILSNGIRTVQMQKLESAGLLDWFDPSEIEIHEAGSEHAKPNPLVLRLLIDRLDVTPRQTAYVGDRPSDTVTAKLCGCISVLLSPKNGHPNVASDLRLTREIASARLRVVQPDLTVTELRSVKDLLV